MNTDVEFHIRQNYPWNKLPANVKQVRAVLACPREGESGERVRVTPGGEGCVCVGGLWDCQCHPGWSWRLSGCRSHL